jgi:hypothetical protein
MGQKMLNLELVISMRFTWVAQSGKSKGFLIMCFANALNPRNYSRFASSQLILVDFTSSAGYVSYLGCSHHDVPDRPGSALIQIASMHRCCAALCNARNERISGIHECF